MNNKLTYIEARDKIWNAYFRDEIMPMDMKFCFCGTLAGELIVGRKRDMWPENNYTAREFGRMEYALMDELGAVGDGKSVYGGWEANSHRPHEKDYEERLFNGMVNALEVLKTIHRERGDYIPEDEPLLTKRSLVTN